MVLSLFSLGIFFYLKKENGGVPTSGLSAIPLLCLVLFMVTYNLGCGPVPWVMLGELLPPGNKKYVHTNNKFIKLFSLINFAGFGGAFATSFNWMLAFLVTKYFESLVILLEIHVCYFLFGGICCLGLIFCITCVPETKGKSLDEIQRLYFPK
jgi:MFS family permease